MATTLKTTQDLTNIAAGNQLQSLYSVAGRGTVLIGSTVTDYDSVNTSMFAVGATDGTVSIANNQEIVKLQSSAMVNPYAVIPTAYDFQVSLTLQEVDVPNIALSLSLKSANAQIVGTEADALAEDVTTTSGGSITVKNVTEITPTATTNGSTTVVMSASVDDIISVNDVIRIEDALSAGNDEAFTVVSVSGANVVVDETPTASNAGKAVYLHSFQNYFDINPANPSRLHSMRIISLAPQSAEGTVAYYAWDFYKVKIVSQGTIDFDRTAAVTLPVTAHCLGNDSDVVGRLWHTDTLANRTYPS